jgi:hypothetical protein
LCYKEYDVELVCFCVCATVYVFPSLSFSHVLDNELFDGF